MAILGSSIFASGDFKMKGFTNTTFPLDVCEKIETLTSEKVIYSDVDCYTESKSAIIEWNDDTTLNKITLKSKAVDSMFDVEYVNSGTFINNFKNGYTWANDIACSDTLHGNSVNNICEKTDVQNGWYLHYSWIDKNGKKSVDKNMIIEFFDKGTQRLVDRKRDEELAKIEAIKAKNTHIIVNKIVTLDYLYTMYDGVSMLKMKRRKANAVEAKVSAKCKVRDVREPDQTSSEYKIICEAPPGKMLQIFTEDLNYAESLDLGVAYDFHAQVRSVEIIENGIHRVQLNRK